MGKNTVPHAKVKIQGADIPCSILESVEIEEEINTSSIFCIQLALGDMEKGNWRYLDMQEISLGKEVKILMGLDNPEEILSAEVSSLKCCLQGRYGILEVFGFDRLHRLSLEGKTRTFLKKKDSDIAAIIAQDWGLQAETKVTSTQYPYLLQNNQNDLQFLLQRAERLRYEVGVKDKTLFFRESKEKDSPCLFLKYPLHIEEFSAELSALSKGGKTIVHGWDMQKKKEIKAEASTGKEVSKMKGSQTGETLTKKAFHTPSTTTIVNQGVLDTQEAKIIAEAHFNQAIVETVVGHGRMDGNPKLRCGKTISIEGIGNFSGIYYVTSTRHRIDANGYFTNFHVRRSAI